MNSEMIARELKFEPQSLRYTSIIGTGGIGSGRFFVLNGNHTLGREESRSGHFLDARDYCKQHIILHYIKVLLGPGVSVIPVGKTGDDDIGRILFNEMKETGFDMTRVGKVQHSPTLFSICLNYPDSSACNLTTDNSASSLVDSAYIETVHDEIKKSGKSGIIMAAPEVPLEARQKLLELGKENGLFCSASFTTGEISKAADSGIFRNIDLVAINIDEASALTGKSEDKKDIITIVQSAVKILQTQNKDIMVSVTAGKQGSWCWDRQKLNNFPALKTQVTSTAGAGDAFFSGILCGLALGLHLFDAQQLASLVAGLSVTSADTINKEIDRHSLNMFLNISDLTFSETIIKLLED